MFFYIYLCKSQESRSFSLRALALACSCCHASLISRCLLYVASAESPCVVIRRLAVSSSWRILSPRAAKSRSNPSCLPRRKETCKDQMSPQYYLERQVFTGFVRLGQHMFVILKRQLSYQEYILRCEGLYTQNSQEQQFSRSNKVLFHIGIVGGNSSFTILGAEENGETNTQTVTPPMQSKSIPKVIVYWQ